MIWVNLKRILKNGFVHFWRNGWVSVATILIMVITLFSIGSLVFGKAILLTVLDQLQDKVDITVYFKIDAEESDITFLQESLSDLSEVKNVMYVSKEDALKSFQERHAENTLIIQSLEELGANPLGSSLNIKAKDPSQYESIARFLEASVFSAVDKINYRQNKTIIDRLSAILQTSKNLGTGISILLALIAVLVTFNTIRLAIYTNREEIKIMRLVGASDRYVRSPFVVGGILYGLISSTVTVILFYPLTFWLGPLSERFFGGINLFYYYLSNFFQMFFILLAVGVLLGVFSSWVATRRYLKA
ncbi:ABC transporter permease [Patescibacteria group bacterium]|nr:ABC transporter permease [Patescibacteria group bacterium]MBU2633045.1 ABC transporter permease [Patescibacteria group bacterium]